MLRLQAQELVHEVSLLVNDDHDITASTSSSSWATTTNVANAYIRHVIELVQDGWKNLVLTKGKFDDEMPAMPFKRFSSDAATGEGEVVRVMSFDGNLPMLNAEAPNFTCGMTHPSGNANVLATYDVVIQIPPKALQMISYSASSDGEKANNDRSTTSTTSNNKDYLKNRYYDVRVVSVRIGHLLSQLRCPRTPYYTNCKEQNPGQIRWFVALLLLRLTHLFFNFYIFNIFVGGCWPRRRPCLFSK